MDGNGLASIRRSEPTYGNLHRSAAVEFVTVRNGIQFARLQHSNHFAPTKHQRTRLGTGLPITRSRCHWFL
jgi:hypothetical protein